uniref:Structural maintenance of chromosomes 2 n=1 Tax=Hucho hucho TaxID=62062 RepID=A0A4W5PQA7_9TELE
MHIKSIILEGFKSYAQRTEINGFDPLFNAITGLNGSGKSNILDSICFLLGISNLSQVRAANLQDLVYKNGQAGITKATVSITFDNADKSQSPLGFETHDEITVTRQVVIGGRNKYLINGVNANNTRVQDLFCSVGLNVNNPHFLIMQVGVLNTILAMIEEAAGTRMYECKKISAQKTIEKKEAKLKEIQTILDEEITPTMLKLKEERSSYLEYQKLMREMEHLSRLYVAWLFVCAEETKVKSAEDLTVMQDSITQLQANMADNENKVQELSAQIQELQKKRDQEVGGVLKGLEETLSEVQRVDAKAQSAVDMKKQNLKEETKKRKELVTSMEEDKKMLVVKEAEVSKVAEKLSALQEEGQKDSAALEAAQCHFKAVSAGLSTNEDGEEATLAGQMMTCKNDMSKADTEAKQWANVQNQQGIKYFFPSLYVDNYKYLGNRLSISQQRLLHSHRQTYPSKTDYPTDPRLRQCHLQNSFQYSTQQTGCSLSQCHPFCYQSPLYHPPLRPVCSSRLAITTYPSPDPLAPGHL